MAQDTRSSRDLAGLRGRRQSNVASSGSLAPRRVVGRVEESSGTRRTVRDGLEGVGADGAAGLPTLDAPKILDRAKDWRSTITRLPVHIGLPLSLRSLWPGCKSYAPPCHFDGDRTFGGLRLGTPRASGDLHGRGTNYPVNSDRGVRTPRRPSSPARRRMITNAPEVSRAWRAHTSHFARGMRVAQ